MKVFYVKTWLDLEFHPSPLNKGEFVIQIYNADLFVAKQSTQINAADHNVLLAV